MQNIPVDGNATCGEPLTERLLFVSTVTESDSPELLHVAVNTDDTAVEVVTAVDIALVTAVDTNGNGAAV